MTTILVTGGAGFVGSHVCLALARQGFTPVTFDNLSRGHRKLVKWGPLEIGDIRDTGRLIEVLSTHQPQAVIHCAALAYVGESMEDPAPYHDINVRGSLSLLEAMRAHGLSRIVLSSTCAVYGVPKDLPITERTPCQPINTYGATKLVVEGILADYTRAYGFRTLALRYFNAGGADPDGLTGEIHDPEPHVIPRVLMTAEGSLPHFGLLGDDWPTQDGTCIRDYVHVSDLADTHVAAIGYLDRETRYPFLNLGTNSGFSVRQIVDVARRVTGHPIPVKVDPRRPGDPPALVARADVAATELGFTPHRSSMETIVETAWAWRRQTQG
ncbi:UDP-glucose 4-epimerase GalE [Rhodospirillum sp. A1_3_36]|uniref:UDP-glucose 4-epimerase GalE n=1 Tax=Rhodospirillum sp. A1_3_36 TaxID=3391666 RepID=UPI0039A5A59B